MDLGQNNEYAQCTVYNVNIVHNYYKINKIYDNIIYILYFILYIIYDVNISFLENTVV